MKNHVELEGIVCKEVWSGMSKSGTAIAKYSIKIERTAKAMDYISIVAFGENAEYAIDNLVEGCLIGINGRLQSGSYINKDNVKVYTLDVIAGKQWVIEKDRELKEAMKSTIDDFIHIPDNCGDSGLPWT